MDPAIALARAQYEWLVELGADEPIGDVPVDRYTLVETRAIPRGAALVREARLPAASPRPVDPVETARESAAAPQDLAELARAMEAADCPLKAGARSFVFADGTAGADLMVIGEAPGREDDIGGRPFLGEAGDLLDRMLAAIGRDRADPDPVRGAYLTHVLPWRPPGDRVETAEIDRWRSFLLRHVALARPRVLLLMGNAPCLALLGTGGITRLRGTWHEAAGLPAMPTLHPSAIVQAADPERKRDARRRVWDDLQMARDRLRET